MICSKYNQRHVYEDIEPIFDSETGALLDDVMVARIIDGKLIRIHMKFNDLMATTEEDQERLDNIGSRKIEK